MIKEYKLFIDGKNVEGVKIIDDLNPTTGEIFARVHMASKDQINGAIQAAHAAQKLWAKTSPRFKESVLLKAADIFSSRADEIKEILMSESGSVLAKCMFEIGMVSDIFRVAAGECRRVMAKTYVSNDAGVFSYSIRRPLGVIAGISPFNAPMILSSKKFAFALAAGNSFVLKPSSSTPVCGLIFGDIFKEAGLPDGVLNIVPCDSEELGDIFQSDNRVSMITFTGSTKVGRQIAKSAGFNMKKCTFELGGKSPVIVLKDADISYAVNTAIFGMFMHQGQICMAGSKVIVEKDLYNEFCKQITAKASTLKVGDPNDKTTIIGPLISKAKCKFIDDIIDDALNKGAKLLTGKKHKDNFYEPTVLIDVKDNMRVFQEEVFGPVISIMKAKDINDSIKIANNTSYGLSAAVITNDLTNVLRLTEELESGMIHINGPTIQDEAHIPFGGIKFSGLGREGGAYSIEEMTELKWITIQGMGNAKYPF